jgi:ankyrin repeat protein
MPGDNNLHKAAHKGDLDECRKYIEGLGGMDAIHVNDPGASDRRALHRAAGSGHVAVVQYLVERGATINLVREKA